MISIIQQSINNQPFNSHHHCNSNNSKLFIKKPWWPSLRSHKPAAMLKTSIMKQNIATWKLRITFQIPHLSHILGENVAATAWTLWTKCGPDWTLQRVCLCADVVVRICLQTCQPYDRWIKDASVDGWRWDEPCLINMWIWRWFCSVVLQWQMKC